MDIKVSVVMPVYNAEKYLAKAIESMLSQTLKEIEPSLTNISSISFKVCPSILSIDLAKYFSAL